MLTIIADRIHGTYEFVNIRGVGTKTQGVGLRTSASYGEIEQNEYIDVVNATEHQQ